MCACIQNGPGRQDFALYKYFTLLIVLIHWHCRKGHNPQGTERDVIHGKEKYTGITELSISATGWELSNSITGRELSISITGRELSIRTTRSYLSASQEGSYLSAPQGVIYQHHRKGVMYQHHRELFISFAEISTEFYNLILCFAAMESSVSMQGLHFSNFIHSTTDISTWSTKYLPALATPVDCSTGRERGRFWPVDTCRYCVLIKTWGTSKACLLKVMRMVRSIYTNK